MLPNTINSADKPAVPTLEQVERHAENVIYQHLANPQPNSSTFTKFFLKVDNDGERFEGERRFKFRLIPEETGLPKSVLYQLINIAGGMVVKDVEDSAVTILNDLYFILREDENPTLPPDTYSSSLIFEAIKRKIYGLPFPNPTKHLVSPSQYEPYDLLKILKREVKWSNLKKKKMDHFVTAQEVAYVNYKAISATTKEGFLEASLKHVENRDGSPLSVPEPSMSACVPPQAADTSDSDCSSTATTPLPRSSMMTSPEIEEPAPNAQQPVPDESNIDPVDVEENMDYSEKDDDCVLIPPTSETSTCANMNSAIAKCSLLKTSKSITDATAKSKLLPSKNPNPHYEPATASSDKGNEHCGLESNVELIDLCEEISTRAMAIRKDLKTPAASSPRGSSRNSEFSPGRSSSEVSQRDADAGSSKAKDGGSTSISKAVPVHTVNEVEDIILDLIASPSRSKECSNLESKGAAAGPCSSKSMKSKSTDSDGGTSNLEVVVVDDDEDEVTVIDSQKSETKARPKYFTIEEDILIIENICKVEAFLYTGGKRLFDMMSNSKDFNGKRSGDSLYERWRKHIKPRLLDANRRTIFARRWNISSDNLRKILEGLQISKFNSHSNVAPDYVFD